MNRRALQVFVGALALVPILLGVSGFLNGAQRYAPATDPTLDSNLRFLFALMIGFGVAFLWMIPKIEKHTGVFRILLGALFLGGVGRLISLYAVGRPSGLALIVMGVELAAPIVCIPWQARIARISSVSSA